MKYKLIPLFTLVAVLLVSGCTDSIDTTPNNVSEKGTTVFGITDAAANMGSISSVMVTIDSISAHSDVQGWVNVSNEQQTYDLLELKASGETALLAQVELEADTYNQLRLQISQAFVIDNERQHEAKLPSGELKLVGELIVEENSTSTATFDFIANESLHITGNGTCILAPVVQLETRTRAQVQLEANNRIRIRQGSVTTNRKMGMDAEGNMGNGIQIQEHQNLTIGNNGQIQIGTGSSGQGQGNRP